MTPLEIRKSLTQKVGGGSFSREIAPLAVGALDGKGEATKRLLVALLWYVDSGRLKKVKTPQMGAEGTIDEAEMVAAYLHWEAMELHNFYYPYDKARAAVYATYDADNQKTATMFWRIASRMTDIKQVSNENYDIIPWKLPISPQMGDKMVEGFRESVIDRKGYFVGELPLKNEVRFDDTADKATIYTAFTFPSVLQQFAPFGKLSGGMERVNIVTDVASQGDSLSAKVRGAKTDKNGKMPRACAMALYDLITMRQYIKATITADDRSDASLAVKSFLVSAMTLYDRQAPKWDGATMERAERTAIRPQIYIGLARARLNGDMLKALPPAPPRFNMRVSQEEAAALHRYMQWGNIRAGEKIPDGVRLPGVVVE